MLNVTSVLVTEEEVQGRGNLFVRITKVSRLCANAGLRAERSGSEGYLSLRRNEPGKYRPRMTNFRMGRSE